MTTFDVSVTAPGRLGPRPIRWAVAALAVLVGVVDLVVTATHGQPMHAAGLSGRALRAVLGGQYALPALGVTLIWVGRGLLRAKRNAWIVAVAASLASILAIHAHGEDAVGLVPATLLLVALAVGRDAFAAAHDPARLRDSARLLVVGGLVVFAYGVLGLRLLDSQFTTGIRLSVAAGDSLRSMFLLAPNHLDPATLHGRWLLESIRVASLIVAFTVIARLLLTFVRPVPVRERRAVDSLVREWGDTALAPFQVTDDKAWFLTADRTCFVAYGLVRGVAVALGDPVGPPAARAGAMVEFRRWCELNGWLPAAHQLTPDGAGDARLARMNVLKIGEEAVIDLTSWTPDSPGNKAQRSALRRVERAGFEVVELPTPIDDATLAQLRAVSQRWIALGHRERTFTVGQFDEARLRDATVLAVRHRDTGRIVAFVDVLASHRSAVGNFDLMRRDPDSPNGVMDVLIVALLERFRAEGLTGMTLGLAPLTNIDGNSVKERTLRLISDRGDAWFNYRGLRSFKDKWSPQWQPRYLAYPSEATLPKVALAVARIGELPDPAAWWTRARRLGRRLPATLCLTALVVWFMAATNGAPALHRELLRHIGLAWRDLGHLQLWRLPTSQLAETTAGFVWSNVALLLLVLPVAEWRLGTRRTVLTFFLCDWVSTLTTLVGMRIASSWSPWAAHVLSVRDAGPSSGAWALTITIGLTLGNRRARRIVTGALFGFLVAALVVHHRLFDLQHLLAASAAWAGVRIWERHDRSGRARDARRPKPPRDQRPPSPADAPQGKTADQSSFMLTTTQPRRSAVVAIGSASWNVTASPA